MRHPGGPPSGPFVGVWVDEKMGRSVGLAVVVPRPLRANGSDSLENRCCVQLAR